MSCESRYITVIKSIKFGQFFYKQNKHIIAQRLLMVTSKIQFRQNRRYTSLCT